MYGRLLLLEKLVPRWWKLEFRVAKKSFLKSIGANPKHFYFARTLVSEKSMFTICGTNLNCFVAPWAKKDICVSERTKKWVRFDAEGNHHTSFQNDGSLTQAGATLRGREPPTVVSGSVRVTNLETCLVVPLCHNAKYIFAYLMMLLHLW